jgi:hypothetical protein
MTGLEPHSHNWSIAEREYARQEPTADVLELISRRP